MAPRRSLDQHKLVLQMHKKGNLYSKISTVLGISQNTCYDIVQRFTVRGHLIDSDSQGRPQILDECGNHEVVRLLNEPSNGTVVVVGRECNLKDWI